ncbi:hypothetical protein [uncultured Exiguobacterium sp.]|uniref:hypothetical protein n=1 Tax=uncultured Exiguobacterium sp. TaxID=202669 RepID=UPI0025FDD349|nr:hypothetical protein [uncultured Exiguobacterium sp.]
MIVLTKKSHLVRLKVLFALLFTLSMIGAIFAPHSVDAATKEYSSYKKLKLGMTATDVAKSLYGKSYKKYIKKEHGVTTLNHKVVLSEIKDDSALYAFSFYPYDEKNDHWSLQRMHLIFKTKQKGHTLYLVQKEYTPKTPSKKRLLPGKKFKPGMTIAEFDHILSGKGLGVMTAHRTEDYSEIGKAYDDSTVEYPEKQTSLFYSYRNPTGDEWMIVEFKYDFDQKRYIAQK